MSHRNRGADAILAASLSRSLCVHRRRHRQASTATPRVRIWPDRPVPHRSHAGHSCVSSLPAPETAITTMRPFALPRCPKRGTSCSGGTGTRLSSFARVTQFIDANDVSSCVSALHRIDSRTRNKADSPVRGTDTQAGSTSPMSVDAVGDQTSGRTGFRRTAHPSVPHPMRLDKGSVP